MSAMTFSHVANPAALAHLAPGTALYYQDSPGHYAHIPSMAAYQQLAPGTAIYTGTPAAAPTTTAPAAAQPTANTGIGLSAKATITQTLASYGLGDLADWAWNLYLQSGSTDYVWSQLPQQPAFKQRFPAYQQLAASGRGISVAQYLNYEQTVDQLAQAEGFPKGFITPDTVTNFLLGNVSTSEVQQRFKDATQVATQLPAQDVAYLQRMTGLGTGDLAAYFIDPKQALPLLEQKIAAAQIGGAAARAGVNLDTDLATGLAQQGVSASQAQQGFDQFAQDQQLFAPLPGQAGSGMSQAQQVGAVFGTDAQATQALKATAAQRVATFQAGGSFSSNSTGFSGVGAALSN